jgi:hypothetical protein
LAKGNDELNRKNTSLRAQLSQSQTNWEKEVQNQNAYKKEVQNKTGKTY